MDQKLSTQFITNLSNFLQNLCQGYIHFDQYVLITGHLHIKVDTKENLEYALNEKIFKNENTLNTFSNSFPLSLPSSHAEDTKSEDFSPVDSNIAETLAVQPIANQNLLEMDGSNLNFSALKENDTNSVIPNEGELLTLTQQTEHNSNISDKPEITDIVDAGRVANSATDNINPIKEEPSSPSTILGSTGDITQKKKKPKVVRRKKAKTCICEVCQYATDTPSRLKVHMLKHTKEKPFSCSYCNKSFRSREWCRNHEFTHTVGTNFVCEICGKAHTCQSRLDIHKWTHSKEKRYKCDKCDYGANIITLLKEHIQLKHTEGAVNVHACEICNKSYTNKSSLYAHMQIHKNKRFECDLCNLTFHRNQQLQIHKRRVHMGEKSFVCDICNKAFFDRSQMKNHRMTHTGEITKPHVCEICGTGFRVADTLRSHMRTHTGERPYQCQNCGKKFAQSGALKVHQRSCIN